MTPACRIPGTRRLARGALLVLLPFLATGVGAQEEAAPAAPRPNILLFVTDDQSWLHTSVVGCDAVDTPALERLARSGVVFESAFTAPSCTPSRSAILTGQSMWRLEQGGQFGRTLPRKFPVFPLLLRKAGYRIGWTGKGWGPGDLSHGGWDKLRPLGRPYNDRRVRPARPGREIASFDYAANFEVFLGSVPPRTPFFFWVGTTQPHRPYVRGSGIEAGKSTDDILVPPHLPASDRVKEDLLDYCLEIDYADTHLARILDLLEREERLENTLIVFTSDNGMALPRSKSSLYDTGTRVPLVASWPAGAPAGRRVEDLVDLSDLAPTFIELAGAAPPEQMTGRSLRGILTSEASGQVDPERDWVVMGIENRYPMRSLRTKDWLFVWNLEPDGVPEGRGYLGPSRDHPDYGRAIELCCARRPPEELYDLRADPWQLHNLIEDEARAATAAALRQRLHDHLDATGDPRRRGENPFGELLTEEQINAAQWRLSMFGLENLWDRRRGVPPRTVPVDED